MDARNQRKLRNLLIDRRFQLKYAMYFALTALVLSGTLGALLMRTGRTVVKQTDEIVAQGARVLGEGRKVGEVVAMSIAQDPAYQEVPGLKQAFDEGDRKYVAQLEAEGAQLKAQAEEMARTQQRARILLPILLLSFVVGVFFMAIVVTHKVAGPLYKIRQHLAGLRRGSYRPPYRLRKGDDMQELFDMYEEAILSLRRDREQTIDLLREVEAQDAVTDDLRTKVHGEMERLRSSL